uniref:Uncharacterized protein n=1 Tax=Siphoviridae sp. ctHMI2 TaxID=2826231 RepID=A0A8S5MK90_9CAUD|nr:MAG TPA: hypothetical protein [Siphoviridae sp. ctHMI2]
MFLLKSVNIVRFVAYLTQGHYLCVRNKNQ